MDSKLITYKMEMPVSYSFHTEVQKEGTVRKNKGRCKRALTGLITSHHLKWWSYDLNINENFGKCCRIIVVV